MAAMDFSVCSVHSVCFAFSFLLESQPNFYLED